MLSLPRPVAVAFDLDGTLIDTESILIEAQQQTLKALGIPEFATDHPRTFGMGMEPGLTRVCEVYGLDYPTALAVFKPTWERLSATELSPMPGARALLMRLKVDSIPMALVTSADPVHARNAVAAIDVHGAFECLIDSDMVSRLKPSPEPYLKAADCLGIAPETILAIEDSGSGVASALAAGMTCVAVHAEIDDRPELSTAHFRMRSLEELAPFT